MGAEPRVVTMKTTKKVIPVVLTADSLRRVTDIQELGNSPTLSTVIRNAIMFHHEQLKHDIQEHSEHKAKALELEGIE
jgi:hypothetical protein